MKISHFGIINNKEKIMECKFCGTIVPENGIFCPNCGKRADGKKACPSCKTLIDESAIYCAFCGARTDGKNVCEKCGTVFEGKFCHVCGAGFQKQAELKEMV